MYKHLGQEQWRMFLLRVIKVSKLCHKKWYITIQSIEQEELMISDSKVSLKTSKMLWLNTMKVRLLCMVGLPLKESHGWCSGAGVSGDITLPQRWAPFLPLQMSPAQTDRPDDSGGRHRYHWPSSSHPSLETHAHLGVLFQFTSIKLSLTLMSHPPGGYKQWTAGAKPRQSSCSGLLSDQSLLEQ